MHERGYREIGSWSLQSVAVWQTGRGAAVR
jgi:hypothetical protein